MFIECRCLGVFLWLRIIEIFYFRLKIKIWFIIFFFIKIFVKIRNLTFWQQVLKPYALYHTIFAMTSAASQNQQQIFSYE